MKSTVLIAAVGICLAIISVDAKKWPERIQRCKQGSSDEMSACLMQLTNTLRPQLAKGVPELHVPPIDPLVLPEVVLDNSNSSSAVGIKANFKNVVITGMSAYEAKRVAVDLDKLELIVDMDLPVLNIKTDYTMDGKVLIMQLHGSGKSDGNFTDVSSKNKFFGKYATKNGKKYIEWTDKKISLKVGKAQMYFDNLFDGNKELTESTNKLINENADVLFEEIKPMIEETLMNLMYSTLQRIFSVYTIDDIFPSA